MSARDEFRDLERAEWERGLLRDYYRDHAVRPGADESPSVVGAGGGLASGAGESKPDRLNLHPGPHSTLIHIDTRGRYWYSSWCDVSGFVVSRQTWTPMSREHAERWAPDLIGV